QRDGEIHYSVVFLCVPLCSLWWTFGVVSAHQPADRDSYNANVLVSEFDYHLPEELIAQEPLEDRAASRMLRMTRGGRVEDRCFRDFPDLLRQGDLVVFNNTKVFPARLYGHRSGSRAQPLSANNPASRHFLHGRVEVLLTKQLSEAPTIGS